MLNVGLKASFWLEFKGKIKILSTHNLLCPTFAVISRKIAASCPSYFSTHDNAGMYTLYNYNGGGYSW